jgi:hypothetical protein
MSLEGAQQPSERKESLRSQEGCGGTGKRYPDGNLSKTDIFQFVTHQTSPSPYSSQDGWIFDLEPVGDRPAR